MKMDYSLFRRGAKIVGCTDWAVFTIGSCILAYVVVLASYISIGIVEPNLDVSQETVYAFLLVLWVPLVLLSVVFGLGYSVAIMLLNATKVNAEPDSALLRAKFWRNWNFFVFICACVLYFIFNRGFGLFAALIILRAAMLIIVAIYIEKINNKAVQASISLAIL